MLLKPLLEIVWSSPEVFMRESSLSCFILANDSSPLSDMRYPSLLVDIVPIIRDYIDLDWERARQTPSNETWLLNSSSFRCSRLAKEVASSFQFLDTQFSITTDGDEETHSMSEREKTRLLNILIPSPASRLEPAEPGPLFDGAL